ncbi:hypothetical protein ADUPG1_005214, partial [Aduncisulcus paluster]
MTTCSICQSASSVDITSWTRARSSSVISGDTFTAAGQEAAEFM